MLAVVDSPAASASVERDLAASSSPAAVLEAAADISAVARKVPVGELLFEQGSLRSFVYRVESGAVRHYVRRDAGRQDLVEFAFVGDIVGLGFLEHHATSAQATLDTVVTPIPVSEIEALAAVDPAIEARLAAAIEVEFALLRERALTSGLNKPVERLAAFLLAVSAIEKREGRACLAVPSKLTCGYVADMLGLTLDGLAASMEKLKQRGLVAVTDEGLELRNSKGLELLAEDA